MSQSNGASCVLTCGLVVATLISLIIRDVRVVITRNISNNYAPSKSRPIFDFAFTHTTYKVIMENIWQ